MKRKQIDINDNSPRDVWSAHEFARRDLIDKKQRSRLKMLMGPIEERQEAKSDPAGRWW